MQGRTSRHQNHWMKVVQQQDNHMVSQYYPRLLTNYKGKRKLYSRQTGGHHLNQVITGSFTSNGQSDTTCNLLWYSGKYTIFLLKCFTWISNQETNPNQTNPNCGKLYTFEFFKMSVPWKVKRKVKRLFCNKKDMITRYCVFSRKKNPTLLQRIFWRQLVLSEYKF